MNSSPVHRDDVVGIDLLQRRYRLTDVLLFMWCQMKSARATHILDILALLLFIHSHGASLLGECSLVAEGQTPMSRDRKQRQYKRAAA